MKTKEQILSEAIPIPGSEFGLHPAVPVPEIRRSIKGQRPSVLARLMRKAGKFDINKFGMPELVPNGTMFDAVVGATRCEWAARLKIATVPAKIWLGPELSAAGHAERFLNELENIKPGVVVAHRVALIAHREAAKLVAEAMRLLPHTQATGVFYAILGRRPTGAEAPIPAKNVEHLRKTVSVLRALKPDGGRNLPGVVVAGVALLVLEGKKPSNRWRGNGGTPWAVAAANGRTRRAGHGGMGALAGHVAAILEGRGR